MERSAVSPLRMPFMYYCKPVGEQQKRLPCRERLPFPQDALAFAHVSARDLQGVGHLILRRRFHVREGQHGSGRLRP